MRTRKRNIILEKGHVVNRCVFIEDVESIIVANKPQRRAKFICHCGKEFTTKLYNVTGLGLGCGCNKGNITHGLSGHIPEHKTWVNIKQRCYNKNSDKYTLYGNRGIKVCDRWLESFVNFLEDMGERPSKGHSIDRIDVNGNYEPTNCRWATNKEQSRNKRNNVFITFNDETHCINEWSEKLSINSSTLRDRISKYGWSTEKALSTPVDTRFRTFKYKK